MKLYRSVRYELNPKPSPSSKAETPQTDNWKDWKTRQMKTLEEVIRIHPDVLEQYCSQTRYYQKSSDLEEVVERFKMLQDRYKEQVSEKHLSEILDFVKKNLPKDRSSKKKPDTKPPNKSQKMAETQNTEVEMIKTVQDFVEKEKYLTGKLDTLTGGSLPKQIEALKESYASLLNDAKAKNDTQLKEIEALKAELKATKDTKQKEERFERQRVAKLEQKRKEEEDEKKQKEGEQVTQKMILRTILGTLESESSRFTQYKQEHVRYLVRLDKLCTVLDLINGVAGVLPESVGLGESDRARLFNVISSYNADCRNLITWIEKAGEQKEDPVVKS